MPKTGENIRKRKDGRWEGRVKKDSLQKGKTKYTSVYGKTYKEVKEKMALLQFGHARITAKTKKENFSAILWMWFENNHIRQKESTKLKYQFIIEKHIIPGLGDIAVSELSETRINSFLNKKLNGGRLDGADGGLSPAYVKNMALVIQSAVRFAAAQEYCKPLKTCIYKPSEEKKDFPVLKKMKDNSHSEYVVSDTSTFVSPRTFEYRFQRQLDLCVLPPVNFHALRHTFATRCIEMGGDVKSLSEFLGHANASVTLNTHVHSSLDRGASSI